MKLRKQLFFVSLITLSLPWAGCQYIQELEKALSYSQTAALTATAHAVSARFSSEPDAIEQLQTLSLSEGAQAIYAHALNAQPILDAYDEEWRAQQLPLTQLQTNQVTAGQQNQTDVIDIQWVAGQFDHQLYIFIRVHDEGIHYYSPSEPTIAADRIELTLYQANLRQKFSLQSSGPGQLQAIYQHQNKRYTEHRIKGQLVEIEKGYQVELAIPIEWTNKGLGLDVFGAANLPSDIAITNVHTRFMSLNPIATQEKISSLPPVQKQMPSLQTYLHIFTRPGVKLHITSNNNALLASSGSLETPTTFANQTTQPWLLRTIFALALNDKRKNDRIYELANGKFTQSPISDLQQTQIPHTVLFNRQKNVTAVALPLYDKRQPEQNKTKAHLLGFVVAEQSAESLFTVTHNAFSKLLIYSFIASLATALTLIGFASWLSIRISRLHRAAVNAISESGDITTDFPVSRYKDELGELSRGYAELLKRLREYNLYLKTLASKLSHELRTPLAIVKSSLDNIEQTQSLEEIRSYALRANEGANRLSGILNAMSSASRLEQAIESADVEHVELNALLDNLCHAYNDTYVMRAQSTSEHVKTENTANQAHGLSNDKKFKLVIDTTSDISLMDSSNKAENTTYTVLGSAELIVQMLDKLIDNALDFSPTNETIDIKLHRKNNKIFLSVENKGPLLPDSMTSQLFDSLVSVRTAVPSQAAQHLGLGLYIVRLICDFHRANVSANNLNDGNGVLFQVTFPAIDISQQIGIIPRP